MSRWDKAVEQAARIQADVEFAKHQLLATTFGPMCDTIDEFESLMADIEVKTAELVELAESIDTVKRNVANHRVVREKAA